MGSEKFVNKSIQVKCFKLFQIRKEKDYIIISFHEEYIFVSLMMGLELKLCNLCLCLLLIVKCLKQLKESSAESTVLSKTHNTLDHNRELHPRDLVF